MPCKATQDDWVLVKSSDKTWSTGGGNGNPLQYPYMRTPWPIWTGKKLWHRKMNPTPPWPPRAEGVQYATGEQLRAITDSFRQNEVTGSKQKWCSVVDVSGGERKAQCFKEQYYMGTCNVRSMNQGKLEMIKQEMARVNEHLHLRNQWTKIDWNGWI